jgi:NTP pyrophosphatase (non-canonical NTP hydrolase)
MLGAIVEEVGELAKEINHLEGFKPKKRDGAKAQIGEELADIIYAIICVANYYKINISSELSLVIEKYTRRDAKRFG